MVPPGGVVHWSSPLRRTLQMTPISVSSTGPTLQRCSAVTISSPADWGDNIPPGPPSWSAVTDTLMWADQLALLPAPSRHHRPPLHFLLQWSYTANNATCFHPHNYVIVLKWNDGIIFLTD